MSSIIYYILIGLGLSIDAFFACLAIGCDKTKNKKAVYLTPFIIGFLHIVLPLIVFFITRGIVNLPISNKIEAFGSYIAGGVFIVMGLFNLLHKEESVKAFITSLIDIIILSITVSIDSAFVGLSLGFSGTSNIFIACLIFGLIAFLTSALSIKTACYATKVVQHSEIIAGTFFIILGILSIFQVF